MNYVTLEDLILKEDLKGILKLSPQELLNSQKISKKSILKLNKLVANCQNSIQYYLCGLIYIAYFSQIELEKAEDDLISVMTSNIIFSIYDHLKGTRLTTRLFSYLLQILEIISKRNRNQDYNIIESIVQENHSFCFSKLFEADFDDVLKNMIALAKTDKMQALNNYVNLMNDCCSLQEQMIIFSERSSKFFSNLLFEEESHPIYQNINFLLNLTKFIETMIFEYSYELEVDKELLQGADESVYKAYDQESVRKNSQDNKAKEKTIIEFRYEYLHELLQQSPNFHSSIYPLLNFLVKYVLIKKDNKSILESEEQEKKSDILKTMIVIFNKVYFNFPIESEKTIENILLLFAVIDESLNFYEEAKSESVKFLTRLINFTEDNSLIQKFSKFTSIYSKIKIPAEKNVFATNLDDFSIKDGFPLNVCIDAGSSFEQIIENWIPNSLLHLAFATKWYDINFEVSYLGDFEEVNPKYITLLKSEKMSFEKNAYRLSLFLRRTGLYKISFDNSHSWFKGKELRYRIFLLEQKKNNAKYIFPFHDIMNNGQKLNLKLRKEEQKQSKYYISDYKAIILLDKSGLHFLAAQPQKSYEMKIEMEQFTFLKFKDRIINALKKAFSENLSDFFQNKLLCCAFVHNSGDIFFPINENSSEKISAVSAFRSIIDDLKINLKDSIINGEEVLIEMIKKQINFYKSMASDNVVIVFSQNDDLFVIQLNDQSINYSDLIYSQNQENIQSFRKAFKTSEKNRELIAFLCLVNTILILGPKKITSIIINKPGIIDLCNVENLKNVMPHEQVFAKVLQDIDLKRLEEDINKIDISYLNIFMKIDDLISL